MSMQFKKPVYTFPNHHYCDFLREYHFYSVPLCINEEIAGYLVLTTIEEVMDKELIAMTELLGYQIANELKNELKQAAICVDSKIILNSRQQDVLRFLACGKTDKAIAIELGLSLATITYHKKNIFRKLSVNCSMEAVVKALKLNLISLDQIVF